MRVIMAALLLVCAFALPPGYGQTPEARFSERAFVTAIEIAADVRDARGDVPRDLTPADLRVAENGIERRIVAVEYLDEPVSSSPDPAHPEEIAAPRAWQVVIFVDALTTGAFTLEQAGRELERHVPDLVKLGPITIIYSDVRPETVVSAARDPRQVGPALNALRKRFPGDRIARIRGEFLQTLEEWQRMMRISGAGGSSPLIERSVPGYVAEEERLLAMGRNNLLRSLGRIVRNDPRMLIYVGDGFDLEPEEFYLRALRVSGAALTIDPQLLRADAESKTKQANVELGRALAVQGWTMVTVGGSSATMALVDDASRSRTMSRGPAAGTPFTFIDRGAPLVALAEETGGRRIADARKLGTALRDVGRRVLITYQIDREPDPRPRRLEISARRPGITVRAPKWVSSTTPEGTAEARALDLMEGRNPAADLAVDARLLPPSGDGALPMLQVSIDLSPLKEVAAKQPSTKLRITTAVEIPGDAPAVIHQVADVDDFSGTSTFVWRAPMKLPDSVGAIAVVAEELTSGAWGGARAGASSRTTSAPVPARTLTTAGDGATAFSRGASERKLVLAFEDCAKCSLIVSSAGPDTELARLLQSFVLLDQRTEGRGATPRIALYASQDRLFTSWPVPAGKGAEASEQLTEIARRSAAAAPIIGRANDLLARGKRGEGELAFGHAYRRAGDEAHAEKSFREAAAIARDAGEVATAQTATVFAALAAANQGRADAALEEARSVAAAPATSFNEAEAHLVIAVIERARGREPEASASLARALQLAPRHTDVYVTALSLANRESDSARLVGDASGTVRLVVRGTPPFSGRTRLQVVVSEPSISSVAFRVDDEPEIVDAMPPFEAVVDLGDLPRRRGVRAVARDAKGAVAGEDAMVLNDRHDEFWVRLRPADETAAVRAEVNLPAGATLARLAFFVDGKAVNPLASDPAAIRLVREGGASVVRAVATLGDGRTAEDARLFGATGYAEAIEARDVEIYAGVFDSSGSPARDLDRSQFRLEENGRRQTISGFEFLGRAPLSVGLVIDSSHSMAAILPQARAAAHTFLERLVADGSSAFVVDFDTSPRLAATRTTQRPPLHKALSGIRADGSTALYDALIFGLLQLQGVPGKRAVVVLTDGRDATSRYTSRDAMRVARESGVAIYAIVLEGSAAVGAPDRLDPFLVGTRGRVPVAGEVDPQLEKIAYESGGRAWRIRRGAGDMEAIYRAIELELRNQYRLTYRTSPGRGADDWREVKVSVDVPGATVRTAAGFVAR